MTDGPQSPAMLAQGGALLSLFALGASSALLLVYLVFAPNPVLLVLEVLFGLFAPVGTLLAVLGARNHGLQARPWIWASAIATGLVWGVVLPTLLVVGIPRFRAYQRDVRQEQALHNLSKLKRDCIAYGHDRLRQAQVPFPETDTGWVPEGLPGPKRFVVQAQLWMQAPWRQFAFIPAMAHFHQYRYQGLDAGRGFKISARGDIDGDGRLATTSIRVHMDDRGKILREDGPTRIPEDTY